MTSFTRTDTARMPSGMTGGRPEPASFGRQLRREDRLVLDERDDHPAAHDLLRLDKRSFGRLAIGKLRDLQVLQPAARRRATGRSLATTTGCVLDLDNLHLRVVHHVVGAVGQTAAREHGDGEHGEDSVAHERPLAFVLHDGDR